MMLTNDFRNQCESIAILMRHNLELRGYDPLPAEQLAHHLGVGVICPKELPGLDETTLNQAMSSSQWWAIALPSDPPIVIYHPGKPLAEREFSIMHELAHIILRHKPERLGRISDSYIARRYPKLQEHEADYLAMCLQFPKVALHYIKQRRIETAEIQAHYSVTMELLKVRLSNVL